MSELWSAAYGKKMKPISWAAKSTQHRDYSEDTAIQIEQGSEAAS